MSGYLFLHNVWRTLHAEVPTYGYQVPLRDASGGEQDLKTSAAMFGGNRAKALDAWGGAFEKMGNVAGSFAKPEPTAAQAVYGDWERKAARSADDFVSDRDWDYVAAVREDYDNAQRTNDAAKFREALTRVGGTLQSYPHLEPHLPDGAAQAAAAKILGGLVQAVQGGARDVNSANSSIQLTATVKSPRRGRPATNAQPARLAAQHPPRALVSQYSKEELLRDADNGWLAGPADPGSKECVAFVKYAVPELRHISAKYGWKEGQKIAGYDEVALEPGTPIATFVDGKYPSEHRQSHAAIFLSYGIHRKTGERGMFVLDQHNKKPLGVSFIPFNRPGSFTSNAYNYSVIEK